jgi:hypothetical protein
MMRNLFLPMSFALACSGPELMVVSVTELGPIEQSEFIRGRDGGYSAEVFEHSVWLYGDTILSIEDSTGSNWANNSASWTRDFDASDGLTGFSDYLGERLLPGEFLPRTEEEQAFNEAHDADDCREDPCGARWALWPGAIVEDPERERALIFYHLIHGEEGAWNFESVGSGIATWGGLDQAPERPVIDEGHEHPTLLWHDPLQAFGAAALVQGDTLYAFACEGGWDKRCLLGQVPLAQALEIEAWRYWDGEAWNASLDAAVGVFDAHTMLSVHHNAQLDRYLALYNRPMDDRVYLRTAPALEGPWSRDEAVFMAEPSHNGEVAYGAMAHPELDREDGRFVYFSYFRSPADWEGEIQLVELELAGD